MKYKSISALFEHYSNRYTYYEEYEIDSNIGSKTHFKIVIPCFNENELLQTLDSLCRCDAPKGRYEVIIVVNQSETEGSQVNDQNQATIRDFNKWNSEKKSEQIDFHLIKALALPIKKAGVGLARKIGMDVALQRFAENDTIGHIVCLDADCLVSVNYLTELENQVDENTRVGHFSFEHNYVDIDNEQMRNGIVSYELHLRYHNLGLKYSGFPFAQHTIGSCMVVRGDVYAKMGGMNQRKAGEDFYFMHKLYPGGGFVHIRNAKVFPSARISDRVPFGTGRAQGSWIHENKTELMTYHPNTYKVLKEFIEALFVEDNTGMKKYPAEIRDFLKQNSFEEKLRNSKIHSTNSNSFRNSIFQWIDGFFMLKMVHFLRDLHFKEVRIDYACTELLTWLRVDALHLKSNEQKLEVYREIDNS